MKFPTSGFILKNYMSADKTVFHRHAPQKMANLEGFQELLAEEPPIKTTYLVALSNTYSSNMPTSTYILCNLRTMSHANRYSTCLTKENFTIRSENILQFKHIIM
jgi:hypothetical protein